MRAVKIITIGIASVFLLSVAVAASAAQVSYDLKCEGNSSSLDGSNGETNSSPFAMTLHVDPDHSSFCQNSCETQEKISRILPSNIIFRAVNAPLPNRLWVADTGQFSYTWAEAAARDEKPSMRFAHGFCTKVVPVSSIDRESVKEKVPAPNFPIGQKHADQPRSAGLSAREMRALINIQNHRPIPASMHTKLWLKGLAQFDKELWVLTDKGEAILSGAR